ncbi:MAG TPA: hypothetical protein VG710_17890, partial [Opitutus sp.]|nr:hypothetical protein [Opitutus sp.]
LFANPYRGSIDTVLVDGREGGAAAPGALVTAGGWALTCGHTPSAVRVRLVAAAPGAVAAAGARGGSAEGTTDFFIDRPDVWRALQSAVPCGWSTELSTEGLAPGEYLLDAQVRATPGGQFVTFQRLPFRIAPAQDAASIPDAALADFVREAEQRLRDDQKPAGYWLTAFTVGPEFGRPYREMNTFLTAMMADTLAPVAEQAGLRENLARARQHLAAQIEADGLVRYHGRPDSPTIPSLGVVITPDADDTALAWRIAGNENDPRLADALAVLKSYRTDEGLYRTWLAPREKFVSIDPGADPNPPDIAIQMHVLMLLARAQPAEARALYEALQGAVARDGLWVYYAKTPLVPILRQAELAQAGYPLELPPARLRAEVAGQEPWVAACLALARPGTSPGETRALLKQLAAGDFAAVRHTPPLVYHNDLSAKVSRYYWSADFGYALWLRLWFGPARGGGGP